MSDRVKQILTSEHGRAMPALAEFVVFETEIAAEQALQILAAAQTDIAAAGKGGTPDAPSVARPGAGISTHQAPAGAINLGAVDVVGGANAEQTKAAWARAVSDANRGIQ